MNRNLLRMATLSGAAGVMLGAFGAHALEGSLASSTLDAEAQRDLLETWNTAVRYQMYHTLALLAAALIAAHAPGRRVTAAGGAFFLGIVLFSGNLYAYVLTGQKAFAMVVPVGGVSFIAGWMLLAAGVWRVAARPRSD